MRLVSYDASGAWRPGVLLGEDVHDVALLLGGPDAPSSLRDLLARHGADLPALAATLERAAERTLAARVGPLSALRLGPPVPDPAKVLCIGINYRGHAEETGRALPSHPDVFAKFASSLIGPADEIVASHISPKLDYEGELALVIGRPCRAVTADEALLAVAGAMALNDISARDLQFNGTQWLPGKAIDASTPCGPALVTLDEVGDIQALELATCVNGVEVQRSSTERMIFSVAAIVAYVSRFLELRPGDVITTGTPDGIGSRRDPPSFLAPGDVVEVAIARLGGLANVVR